jgi:hypothetical protein
MIWIVKIDLALRMFARAYQYAYSLQGTQFWACVWLISNGVWKI